MTTGTVMNSAMTTTTSIVMSSTRTITISTGILPTWKR
jgi:hypothetical protein